MRGFCRVTATCLSQHGQIPARRNKLLTGEVKTPQKPFMFHRGKDRVQCFLTPKMLLIKDSLKLKELKHFRASNSFYRSSLLLLHAVNHDASVQKAAPKLWRSLLSRGAARSNGAIKAATRGASAAGLIQSVWFYKTKSEQQTPQGVLYGEIETYNNTGRSQCLAQWSGWRNAQTQSRQTLSRFCLSFK